MVEMDWKCIKVMGDGPSMHPKGVRPMLKVFEAKIGNEKVENEIKIWSKNDQKRLECIGNGLEMIMG